MIRLLQLLIQNANSNCVLCFIRFERFYAIYNVHLRVKRFARKNQPMHSAVFAVVECPYVCQCHVDVLCQNGFTSGLLMRP